MIAFMRRCFSLFIVATLLFVSSVPMISEAATCDVDAEASMSAVQMDHDVVNEHAAKMVADLPLNRIECGCGCHRSIDALPHLLAPHAFSIDILNSDLSFITLTAQVSLPLISEPVRVQVPPPRV